MASSSMLPGTVGEALHQNGMVGEAANSSRVPDIGRVQPGLAQGTASPVQDWLYQHMTTACDGSVDYSGSTLPMDPLARLVMSLLFLTCIVAVCLMPRRNEPSASELPLKEDAATKPLHKPRERWALLDIVRITCVIGVVSEHSGGADYSEHNHGLVSEWVLQWLFIVSGIGFAYSRSSLLGIILRCIIVFSFGLGLNVIGDAVSQRNDGRWYDDWGNTIFQMFYVVALIALSVLAWPVRAVIRSENEPPPPGTTGEFKLSEFKLGTPATDRTLVLFVVGTAFVTMWACYASGVVAPGSYMDPHAHTNHSDWNTLTRDALATSSTYMTTHLLAFNALVVLHVYLRKTPESSGTLCWVLFALIYIPPILFPMRMAYGPHSLMLYLLGFYASQHPFRGAERFAKAVRSYSMLIFIIVLLIGPLPTLYGRCDRYPAETIWERFRWYFVEGFLTLVLLTRAIEAGDPYDITKPLGWWALWAFCSHVMFARTMPVPYGAVTTYSTSLIFLFVYKVVMPAYREGLLTPNKPPAEPPTAQKDEATPAEPLAAAPQEGPYGTFGPNGLNLIDRTVGGLLGVGQRTESTANLTNEVRHTWS